MKKRQFILSFILYGALITLALGDSSVLGFYKLNEESGRSLANNEGPLGTGYLGYSETSPAETAPQWTSFEEGGGVEFTSHSQVIALPMFTPDSNSFTISAWIKVPDESFDQDLVIFKVTSADGSQIKLMLSMRPTRRLRITYGSTSLMSVDSKAVDTYLWQLVGITVEQTLDSTVSLKAFVGKSDTIDPTYAITGTADLEALSPDDNFLVGESAEPLLGFIGNMAYIRISSPPTDTSFFGCITDCVTCPAGSISPHRCPAKAEIPPEPNTAEIPPETNTTNTSVIGLYKLDEESGSLLANSEGSLGLGYLGSSETSQAADPPKWTTSEAGGGVEFTSHDQVIKLPMFTPGSDSYTISAWIKVPDESFDQDLVIFKVTSADGSQIKLMLSMRSSRRLRITYGSTSLMSVDSRAVATYIWQLVGITVEHTSSPTVSLKAFIGKSDTIDPTYAITGTADLVPLSQDDKFLVGESTTEFIGFRGNMAYIRISSPSTDTSFFGCKTDCVSCPAGSISPQTCPAKGGSPPESVVEPTDSVIIIESSSSSSDGPSGGVIAGIAVGALLIIIAIVFAILVIRHQRAKRRAASAPPAVASRIPSLKEV